MVRQVILSYARSNRYLSTRHRPIESRPDTITIQPFRTVGSSQRPLTDHRGEGSNGNLGPGHKGKREGRKGEMEINQSSRKLNHILLYAYARVLYFCVCVCVYVVCLTCLVCTSVSDVVTRSYSISPNQTSDRYVYQSKHDDSVVET